jgi:hypothetical protein
VVVLVVVDPALPDTAEVSLGLRRENEPKRREVTDVWDDVDGALEVGFGTDFCVVAELRVFSVDVDVEAPLKLRVLKLASDSVDLANPWAMLDRA